MVRLTADQTQEIDHAVDISSASRVSVQVRKLTAGAAGGWLYLQHAASLTEDAFEDVSPAFDLSVTGNETKVFVDLLQFVRWRADLADATVATFLIDLVEHR